MLTFFKRYWIGGKAMNGMTSHHSAYLTTLRGFIRITQDREPEVFACPSHLVAGYVLRELRNRKAVCPLTPLGEAMILEWEVYEAMNFLPSGPENDTIDNWD